MPLARARCSACSEPLADLPYAVIAVRCGQCRLGTNVEVAADGQPMQFETAFNPAELLLWLAAARDRMARGVLGSCLGACPHCRAPLLVAPDHAVSLPCPHCKVPVAGIAADVLVDQWTEPWTKVEGNGMTLEYRLALVDDKGVSAGCGACGLATNAEDPASTCARCGAVTWVVRPSGQRVQLGLRADGVRGDRPFNAVVPIVAGEAMLRSDVAAGVSSSTGASLLGVTGVGCAVAIGLVLLTMCGVAIAFLR